MATQTPNLGLTKPAGTDYVLVSDLNDNSNIIDSSVGDLSQLQTADQSNLVAAINEARQTGGENPPYIGENGNWYEWNVTQLQYEDTGIPATGEAAGFGTPTATASALPAGSNPTVSVSASGTDTDKVFSFSFGIPRGQDGTGSGDMTKSVYDTNDNGIVDNSEALDGHPASYFLPAPQQLTQLTTPLQDNTEYRLGTLTSTTLTLTLPSASTPYQCWIRCNAGENQVTLAISGSTYYWMGQAISTLEPGLWYEFSIKDGYIIGVAEAPNA